MQSVQKSFLIQARVIHALLMREIMTRYGRHNIGFFWLFAEPMIFTSAVTALWALTKSVHESSMAIVPFAVTGYSTVLMWRNSSNRVVKAVEPNLALLYHRNVKIFDVFFARIALEQIGATMSFLFIYSMLFTFGLMKMPADPVGIMINWVLLGWFSFSLAILVGCISELSEVFDRLWHAATYIIFPFSGAMFLVSWLPKSMQDFVLWIPMVHASELIRKAYFGDSIDSSGSPIYLATVSLCLTYIGLLLIKILEAKVEPQ